MPWKEQNLVDHRYEFILHLRSGVSMTEACRVAGIDRKTGYKWQRRFEAEGRGGLANRPRIAHHRPHAVSAAVAELLLELRRARPTWGPKKLLGHLAPRYPDIVFPAKSTVSELLHREGLTRPRKKRERIAAYESPFAGYHGPNAVWCMDFKGAMKLRSRVSEPFTLSDGTSRFCLRCRDLKQKRTDDVKRCLSRAFCEFGLPDALRSDNGPPFASHAVAGLSALSVWLIKLGIVPERIRPGCPYQNGRHERFHRTMEEELGETLRGTDRPQPYFDRFAYDYNHQRPHEALNGKTPAQVYAPSPRCYPRKLAHPTYDSSMALEKIGDQGQLFHKGKSHYLSKVLAGEIVGIDILDDDNLKVFFGPIYLGVIKHHRFWPKKAATKRPKK